MQDLNWNDLKFFLAVFRKKRLSEAGRALKVNETTVSRRLQKLEQALGAALFIRGGNGLLEPTELAKAIVDHTQAIEAEVIKTVGAAGNTFAAIRGVVRLSSVPVLINRFLVPNLEELYRQHPEIEVELLPTADNLDLTKRDADLAIRFARPAQGGLSIKATKLADLRFSAYAPSSLNANLPDALAWIGYDDHNATLPQALWIKAVRAAAHQAEERVRVADIETAIEAVANGLGKSILPSCVADADQRLRRLSKAQRSDKWSREVWLLSHRDQSRIASLEAVKKWLTELPWDND